MNTLFASKKAIDKVGATSLPKTWADFNALAEKMKAAGIIPVANGGIRWDDGMKFEIALGGISPDAYRKAIMELDDRTLRGPEVVAALAQTRKLSDWLPPGVAGQHYSTFLPKFVSGEAGLLLMGGWAQGVIRHLGHQDSDYLLGPAPQDNGKPAFILNADALIFSAAARTGVQGRPAAVRQAPGDAARRRRPCIRRPPARSPCAPTST